MNAWTDDATIPDIPLTTADEEELLSWEPPAKTVKSRRAAARRNGSSLLYAIILASWLVLCTFLVIAVLPVAKAAFARGDLIGITLLLTVAFIMYFWFNGLKDVAYPIAYRIMRHRLPQSGAWRQPPPSVALLYVTCNDFSPESLSASVRQDYPGCTPVILDDSTRPAYREAVDAYAREHGIQVVRRPDRKGFKAGNINNYLRGEGQHFGFFVIIDSDEIIPPGFVRRCLDYFADDPCVGIVQANHVATRNRTTFMRTFAPGVDAHWPAYQAVKARYGFMSLLGHGAMISRDAYEAAGGFPHIVAEDIGLAIQARLTGYRTAFAQDVTCEEEFPPDYAAFEKRHRKWTEGNMEFIRTFTPVILFSRGLAWYEKLDIVLFTFSLPLTGVFSLYVLANAVFFPLAGFAYHYPLWMLAPTVMFLLAPMMNDALTFARRPKARLLSYLAHSVVLFGSMYFTSLVASLRTVFGGSMFHVTPKKARPADAVAALRQNGAKLIAAAVLGTAVTIASGSLLPVILILVPAIFGTYLSVMNAGDPADADGNDKHILLEED